MERLPLRLQPDLRAVPVRRRWVPDQERRRLGNTCELRHFRLRRDHDARHRLHNRGLQRAGPYRHDIDQRRCSCCGSGRRHKLHRDRPREPLHRQRRRLLGRLGDRQYASDAHLRLHRFPADRHSAPVGERILVPLLRCDHGLCRRDGRCQHPIRYGPDTAPRPDRFQQHLVPSAICRFRAPDHPDHPRNLQFFRNGTELQDHRAHQPGRSGDLIQLGDTEIRRCLDGYQRPRYQPHRTDPGSCLQ